MLKKKILVTGGLGYIGSHTIVELIKQGFEPIIIDSLYNSNLDVLKKIKLIVGFEPIFFKIDCTNYNGLIDILSTKGDINGIIHFAAYKSVNESISNPIDYYHNNLISLINILKISKKLDINNIIFSSSCTVYGTPSKLPVTEEMPYGEITNPYGQTKMMCEKIIIDYVKSNHKIKAVLLRYFNPVGAHPSGLIGESPNGIPNNLLPYIIQVASGKLPYLRVFGNDYNTKDGTCLRDFIHVCDLADAHIAAFNYSFYLKDGVCDIFNIGTGIPTSVLELIETFEKVNNLKINYTFDKRRDGDIENIYADASKANSTLSWKSKLTITQAVEDAWRWEKNIKI